MLNTLVDRLRGKKTVIVGIGNTLRGDDGLGPVLVTRLKDQINAHLIDAGDVPENFLGPIESAEPQVVLLIDAAELGKEPGDAAVLEVVNFAERSLTTHNASLALFAQLLQQSSGADVIMLAVQPHTREFGAPLSDQVLQSLEALELALTEALGKKADECAEGDPP